MLYRSTVEEHNPEPMRAQVTIFMVLGIVILASVVFMFMLASSQQNPAPPAQIQENAVDAQTCLARATRESISLLADDAAITTDEYGPLPEEATPYVYLTAEQGQFIRGQEQYYGLCDRDGPNARTTGRYHCPSNAYSKPDKLSIQEQLQFAITQRTRACLQNQSGTAEVILQQDALQVRYDKPPAQHNEPTPLTSTWTAIDKFLYQQMTNLSYAIQQDVIRGCTRCQPVTVTREEKELIDGEHYDKYVFSRYQDIIATIYLEDRGFYQNVTYPDGSWELQDNARIDLGDSTIDEDVSFEFYAFDNDTLELVNTGSYPTILSFTRDTKNTMNWTLSFNVDCDVSEVIDEILIQDGYGNSKYATNVRIQRYCGGVS